MTLVRCLDVRLMCIHVTLNWCFTRFIALIRPTSISSYDVTFRPFLLGNVKATSQIEASKPVGIWQVENDNSDTSKPPWSLLQCSDVTTCVTSKYDILKAIFDINQLLLSIFPSRPALGGFVLSRLSLVLLSIAVTIPNQASFIKTRIVSTNNRTCLVFATVLFASLLKICIRRFGDCWRRISVFAKHLQCIVVIALIIMDAAASESFHPPTFRVRRLCAVTGCPVCESS